MWSFPSLSLRSLPGRLWAGVCASFAPMASHCQALSVRYAVAYPTVSVSNATFRLIRTSPFTSHTCM